MKQYIQHRSRSEVVNAIYDDNLSHLIITKIDSELEELQFYINKYKNSFEYDLELVYEQIKKLQNFKNNKDKS